MKGQFNLNTLIGLLVGALLIWVGTELNSNGKTLSAVVLQMTINTASISELRAEMKSAVPRSEFNARLLNIETRLREIDVEIYSLRVKTGGGK